MTIKQKWMMLVLGLSCIVIVYFLQPILMPFFIGIVLAYLGDPLVDKLEKLKFSRSLSVLVVFVSIFVVLALILFVVTPMLFGQIKIMLQQMPSWGLWIKDTLIPRLSDYFDLDPSWFDANYILKKIVSQWSNTSTIIDYLSETFTSSSLAVVGFFVNLFLVPVVTFYLLRDWDYLMEDIRLMLPVNLEQSVVRIAKECNEVLGAFVKGQLMVMLALGAIYGVGLWLLGVQFSLLIGFLSGILSIIPYMGFVVGFLSAILVAFFQFDTYSILLAVTAVFLVGQLLESYFLTPKLIGNKIGLHPVAVIFALMAGAQILGFIGMLTALPLAAVIMVLLRNLHANYKDSDLYHEGQQKEL